MSEQTSEQQQNVEESPLRTERGYTSVNKSIVSQIAERAARGVRGIYLEGRNQQSTGGGSRGSRGPSRGISVEVGMVETSVDVVMGMDYGWNIGDVTERLRENLTERIETLTGLNVREINITISDVVLPDKDRLQSGTAGDGDDREDDRPDVHRLENLRDDDDYETGRGYSREYDRDEEAGELRDQRLESERDEEDEELRDLRARIERGEETEDERVRRARTESLDRDDDEEEVRVEGRDLDEGETAEIDPRDDDDIDRGTGERRGRE